MKQWFLKLERYLELLENKQKELFLESIQEDNENTTIDQQRIFSLITYSMYARYKLTRNSIIQDDAEKLIAIINLDHLPLESIGWLISLLSDNNNNNNNDIIGNNNNYKDRSEIIYYLIKYINNNIHVDEDRGSAFNYSYYNNETRMILFHTKTRTDAVILEALLMSGIQTPLIAKLVQKLLEDKVDGTWYTTQENCWVILTLNNYFRLFENDLTTNYLSKIWFGNDYCGETNLNETPTTAQHLNIPMHYAQEISRKINNNESTSPLDLLISKKGHGRLYYRINLTYVPVNLKIESLFNGFEISREFLDNNKEQTINKDEQGIIKLNRGDKIKIRITIQISSIRYYVGVTEQLPAGLIYVKSEQSNWFEHESLSDTRIQLFTSNLPIGRYQYVYTAHAVTIGNFIMPAAKVEEMYRPHLFGRTNSDRMIIQ